MWKILHEIHVNSSWFHNTTKWNICCCWCGGCHCRCCLVPFFLAKFQSIHFHCISLPRRRRTSQRRWQGKEAYETLKPRIISLFFALLHTYLLYSRQCAALVQFFPCFTQGVSLVFLLLLFADLFIGIAVGNVVVAVHRANTAKFCGIMMFCRFPLHTPLGIYLCHGY